MNSLFEDLQFVRVYLDYILVLGESEAKHIGNLKKVFEILKQNRITVNYTKSNFMRDIVEYLGVIIDRESITNFH